MSDLITATDRALLALQSRAAFFVEWLLGARRLSKEARR